MNPLILLGGALAALFLLDDKPVKKGTKNGSKNRANANRVDGDNLRGKQNSDTLKHRRKGVKNEVSSEHAKSVEVEFGKSGDDLRDESGAATESIGSVENRDEPEPVKDK